MQLIILTAKLMWERAITLRSRLWLGVLLLAVVFVVAPTEEILLQLVSFSLMLPAIFLLTDWNGSAARTGLLELIKRGDKSGMVRTAEWLIPSLAGMLISSIIVFAVSSRPPWQFWASAPLISISFSLFFLIAERYQKFAGRTLLVLLWLSQLSEPRPLGKIVDMLMFTNYPAAVLAADPASGSHHPDSFVLASLITVFIAAGTYTLLLRRKS